MEYNPHPYQKRGKDMLVADLGGAGLGLDPGMGKTGITLAAANHLIKKYPGLKVLVIVPINPMYGTWPDEIKKWEYDLTYTIIHGSPKKRKLALQDDVDIYMINPEGIRWLFEQTPSKDHPDWHLLIVDESTKFKASRTKRFKALKAHLGKFYWRWILTGTIAPNGLEDLFGQVYVMDEGDSLGKYITHYRRAFFYRNENGFGWKPQEGATERVIQRIEPRVLMLKAEDHLQMPDMMKVTRKVSLDERIRKIYQEVENDFVHELRDGGTILAANSGAAGMKCRQIANGAVYGEEGQVIPLHDGKLAALESICEETNGHPLLIMYEFKHDRDRIQHFLGSDCVCVTGLSGEKLVNVQERFNSGVVKYLLMHPGSVHGMNIQKNCHHIVWFSIIWNLEFYIQANTRLYRQGQTSPSVMVYHLACEKTIDTVVMHGLRNKDVAQADIERLLERYCGVPEQIT